MNDCRPKDRNTVETALICKREELLYDIRNYLFVEGDIMEDGQQHQRHVVQDVGEAGNVDRVTRVLDLAHAEAVEMLYPFSKQEIRDRVLDDRLRERKVYGIILNVPREFSQTTLNALEKLVHEYMVCRAVADWLSISNTQKAAVWKEKTEELASAIRSKPRLRRGPLRIRQSPF